MMKTSLYTVPRARHRFRVATLALLLTGLTVLGCDSLQQANEAKRRSQSKNNMKMVGLGFHNFHDVNRAFPTETPTADGQPPMSWQTQLLPYIDRVPMYQSIDLNSAWDAPSNRAVFQTQVSDFQRPGESEVTNADGYALSHLAANSQLFTGTEPFKFRQITDGSSNTIMAGEVAAGFQPWGQPGNFRDPAAGLSGGPNNFGSQFIGGCHFLMCDGSVQFISENIDPNVLKALASPDGGEVVGVF